MACAPRRRLIPPQFRYSVGRVKSVSALLPAMVVAAMFTVVPLCQVQGQQQSDPIVDRLLDVELPPILLEEPIELPPVQEPDAALLLPLEPIERFDMSPRDDFKFSATAAEGLRYRVVVEGLEPVGLDRDFQRLSQLYRGQNRTATAAQIAYRTNSDAVLLERLLFSEGWYSATVDPSIMVPDPPGAPVDVMLTANPGDRYHWRDIVLDLIPEDLPQLKEGFGLKVGDPIRAIAVEEAEGALKQRLNQEGYPFAEIGVRDVVLDNDAPTGTYLLTGDLGPIGRIGRIIMVGSAPFDADHAAVIARFEEGQIYDASLLDDFRRALIATQLFGGVTAEPVDSGERDDHGAAITNIEVRGNAGPLRRLGGQIGYSTGEGFRVEGAWQHRNFWAPEGRLTTRAVLGTREQGAAAEMLKSNFGQRDRVLTLQAGLSNVIRPAFRAETFALGANLARNSTPIWQKPWTWSFGLELRASRQESRADSTDPDMVIRQTFLIATVPVVIGRDTSDDLLDPQTGWRLQIAIAPELSREDRRIDDYLRLVADASYYYPVRDDLVLAGRLRAGILTGAELDNIAPSRRLYAGGGGSVRGFEFQGIGPTGTNNRPTGGRGLAEASIEARYRFGDFGVVAFVDAGTINQDPWPTLSGIKFGAGVGARYFTSFGPVRIDVARAINRGPLDPVVAAYISIGQSF